MAQIDEIDKIDDGRVLSRPVRFHFGITSFGVARTHLQLIRWAIGSSTSTTSHRNMTCRRSCTSSSAGARRSSSTASGWTHPRAHSSSFALQQRTAFAEEPGTTIVSLAVPGKAYEAQGGEIWMPLNHLYESGEYAEAADRGRELIEAHPEYAGPLYNLAARASPVGQTTRSGISDSRSTARNHSVRLLPRMRPTRSARPLSRNWFRATQPSQPGGNRLRAGRTRGHSRTLAQVRVCRLGCENPS